MQHYIDNIQIANFKSIRNINITDCRRINLFIGHPNVGKSNIVEALSSFTIPYLKENSIKRLSSLIRLENEPELFYNGNIDEPATILTNIGKSEFLYNPKQGLTSTIDFTTSLYANIKVNEKLLVSGLSLTDSASKDFNPPIKRYTFKTDVPYKKSHAKYLTPPYGSNLLSIIENYPELRQDVINLFKKYDLEIAFDKGSQTIKIIQTTQKGIFLIPYNSVADTLQRIIFYKAAITSNSDSVLLFEEPEAHSFPPYMTHLTQEMIAKKDNQYFINTHSPFILNDLVENCRNELAIFIVYYEDYETKVKQLTENDLHDVFQYGIDLFTNNESFI